MTRTHTVYTLTDIRKRANQTLGYPMTCRRCGEPLKVGEQIIRRRGGYKAKYYHKNCYESMFFDPTVRVEA